MVTYTGLARICTALSDDDGKQWKPIEDVFKKSDCPGMDQCLNPAVTIGKDGTIHMVFRAFANGDLPVNTKVWYTKSKDGLEW